MKVYRVSIPVQVQGPDDEQPEELVWTIRVRAYDADQAVRIVGRAVIDGIPIPRNHACG